MKIAYCIPSLYTAGGMERVLSLKVNYLADVLNYDITIILTDGKDKEPYFSLSSKIKVINLNLNFDRIYSLPLIKKAFLYQKLQIKYRKSLSHVLHDIKPDITISLLRREINFINKIKDGSAKIGELHSSKKNYRNMNGAKGLKITNSFLSKIWMNKLISELKQLTTFVVLTYEDKENFKEISNIKVIHNPLPFWSDKISNCDTKQVIFVGRYSPEKGIDLMIKTWKTVSENHPDWTLRIYGAGDRRYYQKLVDENDLRQSVHLEGATLEIDKKYLESSIFVLSSRFEGFGMALAEAMSCGLPVVSFDCPCGPKDIVTHGEDGFLVKSGDTDMLADHICQLINNESLRRHMGANARQNIARLQIQHIAAQWNELFKEIKLNRTN